jgi:hypothetical protein
VSEKLLLVTVLTPSKSENPSATAELLTVTEPLLNDAPARIVPRLNVVGSTLADARRYTFPLTFNVCEPALIALNPLVPAPSDA